MPPRLKQSAFVERRDRALFIADITPRRGFPAVVLWKFRVASIGAQFIMWATLGLLFVAWTQRSAVSDATCLAHPSAGAFRYPLCGESGHWVDCSIRKEEPPDVVRGFVVQMLFGRSMELIVQPNAHDVEVGTATPVKHETSIALSVRCQKSIETYRQPFCTRT